jgi:hypothetical protein
MMPSIMPTFAAHQRRQQQQREQRRRRRIMSIVHSQVFDDEECLDLCPSDTTSHMGNPTLPPAHQDVGDCAVADTTADTTATAAATTADTTAATTRMTNTNATIATPTTTMAITQDDELVPGTQRSTSYLFDQDDEQCLDLCNLEESTDEPAAAAAAPQPPQQQVVKESSTMTGISQSSNTTTVATERSNLVQSPPPPPPPQEQQKEQQHAQQHPKEQALKVERARIRLEMAYELFQTRDDCDLDDISTCASPCQDCQGTGTKPCRGCRGAK